MQAYFRRFQQIAEAGSYYELAELPVPKPALFNWATEIPEGLHVATHPDKPALVVAHDAGHHLITYAELFAFSRTHLAPYKMPRILEVVDELPKTSSGKIRRVELWARAAAQRQEPWDFLYEKEAG